MPNIPITTIDKATPGLKSAAGNLEIFENGRKLLKIEARMENTKIIKNLPATLFFLANGRKSRIVGTIK
jgi:hypothetical protein